MSFLLGIIYLSFISLGLPDALLGSAWPNMYPEFQVPVSYAGMISIPRPLRLERFCPACKAIASPDALERVR